MYIGLTALCVALSVVGSATNNLLLAWAFAGMAVTLAVVVMVETLRGDNA